MFNYVELVKALNEISNKTSCYYCHGESLDCKTAGCYISDAADAIEELLAAVPHWISVEERLPEPRTVVLLFSHEGTFVGYMHDDKRFTVYASSYPERPTHWMPLPESPEEVE